MSQLRSPICCVLGHVDVGKTLFLDKIRNSNVQKNEVGGITQQIGATYFPAQTLIDLTAGIEKKIDIPGLLFIDTPGHDCFDNLRVSGANICDIAVVIVDIMKGVEKQTKQCIQMLKAKKIPFIVGVNKIDRLYDWRKSHIDDGEYVPFRHALQNQKVNVIDEYETKIKTIICQFAELELNATLYYKNKDFRGFISLVPFSAVSGEGIPDLIMLMIVLTQKYLQKKIIYREQTECTIMDVKRDTNFGTSLDVILSNGELRKGDSIAILTTDGSTVTKIQSIMAVLPLKESKNQNAFVSVPSVTAAQGVKIIAKDIEKAVAGTNIYIINNDEDKLKYTELLEKDLEETCRDVMLTKNNTGVHLHAPSMGSLLALYNLATQDKIPIRDVGIGHINKTDIIRVSTGDNLIIIGFDLKIDPEIEKMAADAKIKIINEPIIYHVMDKYKEFMKKNTENIMEKYRDQIITPCILEILPEHIYNTKSPIIIGVKILEGTLQIGTELATKINSPERKKVKLVLGKVIGIQKDRKDVASASKNEKISVKIDSEYEYSKHFKNANLLVSNTTHETVAILEKYASMHELNDKEMLLSSKIAKYLN